LIRLFKGKGIIITRGHEGLSLIGPERPVHIPAQAREVFDVTGAGDTLIAHFALALAAGATPAAAARLGNAAAGVAVAKLGAVTVSPQELAAALEGQDHLAKVRTVEDLRLIVARMKSQRRRVVFTNGCFDLFHSGHVRLLREARALGDVLIVALNTDRSVRRIKGAPRPILPEADRAAVLSALPAVDYLVFFDQDTPEALLEAIRPDVLVKGRQAGRQIVGAEGVRLAGGKVVELPLAAAPSTGELVRRLRSSEKT
jgi:D-beta-D-heptose 7-phosphate kinase/D-beta-D-heptose 1-phosphate adenosyltransferase